MRALIAVETALLAQRGTLIGWVPLFLGCGIGWYFSILYEPDKIVFGVLAACAVFLGVFARYMRTA